MPLGSLGEDFNNAVSCRPTSQLLRQLLVSTFNKKINLLYYIRSHLNLSIGWSVLCTTTAGHGLYFVEAYKLESVA